MFQIDIVRAISQETGLFFIASSYQRCELIAVGIHSIAGVKFESAWSQGLELPDSMSFRKSMSGFA